MAGAVDGGTHGGGDEAPAPAGTSGWRRPALAGLAAFVVLAVAVIAVTAWPGSDDDTPGATGAGVAALAGPAPEVTGSVTGAIGTGCAGMEDCSGGTRGLVDLGDLSSPVELPGDDYLVLDDQRWLERTPTGGTAPWGERNMPEWWLATRDGDRRSLGPAFIDAAVALADGRIAAVWTPITEDGTIEVRTIALDATTTRVALPEGFQPSEVVAGPDGQYAVLGYRVGACCHWRLLVLGPDGDGGDVVRHDVALHDRDATGPIALDWGATGLIALAPSFPEHPDEGDEGSWVTVVDPAAGAVVATVDGWLGTAWSPDGTSLLVARRSGPDEVLLALLHGVSLDERADVGTVPVIFTPLHWAPPPPDAGAGGDAAPADGGGTPPTHGESGTEEALLTGTLAGTPDCLWLEPGDGARYALLLPPGSTTRTDGDMVVLVDAAGDDVARTGDAVEVTGGYRPGEPPCPEADATGPAIVAGGVRAP